MDNSDKLPDLETEGEALEEVQEGEDAEGDVEEAEAEAAADEQEGEDGEGEGDEAEEIELVSWTDDDGVEWEIPKAVQPALLRTRDYRSKTQALSAERRQLAEQREQFEQERQRDDEDFQLQAQLYQTEASLKQYESVDWNALHDTDPDADKHWRNYQLLKDRRNDLSMQVRDRQTKRTEQADKATSTRLQQTQEFAETNIPGWSQEVAAEIERYAIDKGYTQESLMINLSPQLLAVLHDGLQAEKIRANAKRQPKPKGSSNVRPLKTTKGRSGIERPADLSKVSMKDYYAARKRGVGG